MLKIYKNWILPEMTISCHKKLIEVDLLIDVGFVLSIFRAKKSCKVDRRKVEMDVVTAISDNELAISYIALRIIGVAPATESVDSVVLH